MLVEVGEPQLNHCILHVCMVCVHWLLYVGSIMLVYVYVPQSMCVLVVSVDPVMGSNGVWPIYMEGICMCEAIR